MQVKQASYSPATEQPSGYPFYPRQYSDNGDMEENVHESEMANMVQVKSMNQTPKTETRRPSHLGGGAQPNGLQGKASPRSHQNYFPIQSVASGTTGGATRAEPALFVNWALLEEASPSIWKLSSVPKPSTKKMTVDKARCLNERRSMFI